MPRRRTRADDHDDPAVTQPELHVAGDDAPRTEVAFGPSRGPLSSRTRLALVVLAGAVVAATAVGWWLSDEPEETDLSAALPGAGRLVVDTGADPSSGDEADVRVDVAGRQRCQGVARLEVTGRSLCGAGGVVAVVVPAACRVRLEPTSGPPVEATRLEVPGTGLAVAAGVVDARGVTPSVRVVVLAETGGRLLLTDVARRGDDGARVC